MKKDPRKGLKILYVIIGLIIAGLIAAVVVYILTNGSAYGIKKQNASSQTTVSASVDEHTVEYGDTGMSSEKWEEGDISYQGKKYRFNSNLEVFLLMGIDNDNTVEPAADSLSGGQADALFLVAADKEEESMKVVAINRNTMTQVSTCDAEGNDTGYVEAQICTQHGFGDGKKLSCIRTEEAVSNLFYGLPISGYLSLNIGGIRPLNSVVGGVEVEVLDDIHTDKCDLTKGTVVTLTDDQAYYYLHYRDTSVFDSASGRLERQKQYIDAYLSKLKKKVNSDGMDAADFYNAVSDYVVTDLTVSKAVKTLMTYSYDSSNMYSVPGEVTQNGEFEEFHVDEDALYDLIIQLFYKEVKE